jgi:S1-C subfamily serine protease
MGNAASDWDETRRAPLMSGSWPALVVAAIALCCGGFALWRQQAAIDAGNAAQLHAQRIERELGFIQAQQTATSKRLAATRGQIRARSASVAPLAARALRSVFTVRTSYGLGTGFLAWTDAQGSYIITANHVVEDAPDTVTITRKNGSWSADVVVRDKANDLALLRANGRPANAKPLWQKATKPIPRQGQELVLLGSPYGLAGTVTTGIISRITSREIQTDAAANPGNSGGPAIDRGGHVVGILVAGGGENINFAVRIERACAKLRRC